MNEQMRAAMREASRLTQAGRLGEATALIQQALQGHSAAERTAQPAEPQAETIIEGSYRVLDPAPAAASTSEAAPRRKPRPWQEQAGRALRPVAIPERGAAPVPNGEPFLSASYNGRAGTRSYKLYVPSAYRGQALPLIVMLHGCTQTPDDFAAGTTMNRFAEEQGFFVAYPAQAANANRSRCWNWFQAADQRRDQGEPSLIAGITRQVISSYQIDTRRVYVAGLSAGGAMAVIMGATYPDLYAAVGVHSGLPYRAAHDLPSALAAMQQREGTALPGQARAAATRPAGPLVPTIVFHGDQDTTVHPRNGEAVIAQALAAHMQGTGSVEPAPKLRMQSQRGQAAGGRSYTRSVYRDAQGQTVLEQWLIHGAGHAWSGGSSTGSFSDPSGPSATQELLRFFAQQAHAETT
jgi:poly(hydroxyalkanoate) depolymerase family esterase